MMLFRTQTSVVAASMVAAWAYQVAAIQLWTAPAAIPTSVPARCRAALVQNITCANYLVTAGLVSSGAALEDDEAAEYCTNTCYDSLTTFQRQVTAGCGTEMYVLHMNSTYMQSPAELANSLVWAYDVSCIKDSAGFCLRSLYAGLKELCSDCTLKYAAAMLNSEYGRQQISPEAFSELLSSCSANPTSYTYTYTSTSVTTTSTSSADEPLPTCLGETYTVKAEDTCLSISRDKGVGTDLMINRNYLDYNCTTLSPGMSLCLQDKCTIKTLDENSTCSELIRDQPFGLVQLLSWNPSIHRNCDNLDSMIGRSICLSPPGGGTYDVNVTDTYYEYYPTLTSSLISNWVTAVDDVGTISFTTSWYTPTLNLSATPTPWLTITYNETLASELAQQTQYCWLNDDDFANGFNEEDYPEGCQSLLSVYCFPTPGAPVPTSPARIPAMCTPDRSEYIIIDDDEPPASTTSAPATTPTPYQPNMIHGCKRFYKVVSGDTCQKILDTFGLSLQQFVQWNPDVGEDCRTMFLDYYVCVEA